MTDFDLTALMPPPPASYKPDSPQTTSARDVRETQMAVLKDALSQSLMPDDNGREMLKRQMATLDTLFAHLVADYAAQKSQSIGYSQNERLAFILRLQQNCATTARALGSMEYMAALRAHLCQNNEQTIDEG